jgi:hypothetical protein
MRPNPEPASPASAEEPSVVGVRVRPAWPMALYGLLVASAALALYAQRAPVAPGLARLATWTFLAFAVGFAGYRFALVTARRYSPFKAFFQVLMAALFFMLLLWPGLTQPPPSPAGSASLMLPLTSADPEKRALAAEVAGLRGAPSVGPSLVPLLADDEPSVRDAAHAALVRLNGGVDLGPAAEPGARAAWRARFP